MKGLVVFAAALMAASASIPARAADPTPIRIGDIESYSALPVGTRGYRQGWQLALEQINAAGGVNGRPMEFVTRDDAGKPDVGVTQANELVNSEHVDLLAGTILSNVGVAVADFAKQHKMYFMATQSLTDSLVAEKGNHYTFRLRASTFTQAAILAKEAAKLPAKRWATVAPNYEFGQSTVASFEAELKRLRPDVEFVSEQWPPLGKIDAGATVQATLAAKPDAIFNVTFGTDLVKFVREGNTRGAFTNRPVVSILTGEPEYLAPLKEETPTGWLVTGYPEADIKTPAHLAFANAYRTKFKEEPNVGAVMGYSTALILRDALKAAGGTDTEKLVAATEHLTVETPIAPVTFRAIDHQSTLGVYIGHLGVRDGQGYMTDWTYVDGSGFQPSDAAVEARRRP
jgi:branched-chain amino acid transport system substrate-binding protein